MAHIRDAESTRQRLLRAAFLEFQRSGFRSADLQRILRQAKVTKGALYHHFRSKRELGYAVVEEMLADWITDRWLRPLADREDPLAALVANARWGERSASSETLALGCPLLTLSQELCGSDEGFRLRLSAIHDRWRGGLVEILEHARERGQIRADVDLQVAATFIVAAWEGSIGLAKSHGSVEVLRRCRRGLEGYLATLRP